MRINFRKLAEDNFKVTKSNCYKYAFYVVTVCSVLFLTLGLGTTHAQFPVDRNQTLDDLFAAVARQVPEFGGMFLGENEVGLRVYLTDVRPHKVAAVQRAIAAVFGAGIIPRGGIQPIRGRYGFLQLRGWYAEMMGPILSIPGVTLTDINEAKNRLGIGIKDPRVEAQVVEQLQRLGIPLEVVIIEVIDVELANHTVQDRIRPVIGGIQIQNGSGAICTLGFNAIGQTARGLVTNSHCTPVSWGLDGTTFYQPSISPANKIGVEAVDPAGFMGFNSQTGFTCPSGLACRYSDSALGKYDNNIPWEKGFIARTTAISFVPSAPILTVDHNAPRFGLVPPSKIYLVNLTLNKVGRTTGWTNGKIVYTCADFGGNWGPNNVLLCQYLVGNPANGIVNGGDSGAPVFRQRDGIYEGIFGNTVELYGIVWGKTNDSEHPGDPITLAGGIFVFSPIGGVKFQRTGIQTDLGQFNPYVDPPCVITFPISAC